jgi:L-ascorbate metabolism protein UlaG (beta-lactamase superfamily)
MDITYLGHASFRLKGKNASLVTDPFDPQAVGLKYPSVEADIVTISHDHNDHNKVELVKNVKRVINGPGEYEVSGVSIVGVSAFHDDKSGEQRGKNTIYVIEMDGLRTVHLGDLGHKLTGDTLEDMGAIDVLMVPVGGEYTIGLSAAIEIVRTIEPSVVIPMHYKVPGVVEETFGKLLNVDAFLTEIGLSVERVSKLVVKRSDLMGEQKVVVLEKR